MDESDLRAELEKLSEQITALAQSLTAQIKSMTETIYNNNMAFMRQLVSLESWRDAHEKMDVSQHGFFTQRFTEQEAWFEAQVGQLAKDHGAAAAKVEALEKVHEQAKGAAWAWRIIVGGAVAALGILEAWIHGGHKP